MSRAQDLETLRACLTARMETSSIAMTLGRSLKWVEARIAEIQAEERDEDQAQAAAPPAAAPEATEGAEPADGRPQCAAGQGRDPMGAADPALVGLEANPEPDAPETSADPRGAEVLCRLSPWTPDRLLVVRKASKLGLDLDEIAEIAGAPREEIDRALNAMLGRSLEEAADELAQVVSDARAPRSEAVDPGDRIATQARCLSAPEPEESAPQTERQHAVEADGENGPEWETAHEFAARRKVQRPVVSQWIARGFLSSAAYSRRDGRLLIRVAVATAELAERGRRKAEAAERRGAEQAAKAAPKPKSDTPAARGQAPLTGLVTKSCYAIHRGVSQSAVSHAIERGRIHGEALVPVGDEIRIDVAKADAQLGRRKPRDAGEPPRAVEATPIVAPTTTRPEVLAPRAAPPTRVQAGPPAYYNVAPRPIRGRSSAAGAPKITPAPPAAVRSLKEVTAPVARWTARYLARGVSLELLAELFDRDPEALGRAAEAWA